MNIQQYNKELTKISKLYHTKNEFLSDLFELKAFPNVLEDIKSQLSEMGLRLLNENERSGGSAIPYGRFELQTHEVSVTPHEDDVPVGTYFALYPVKSTPIVHSRYPSLTVLRYFLNKEKRTSDLVIGDLIVFSPRRTHELLFYGEATTFMIFSVKKDRS